jgi:hypothetical protein
MPLLDGEMRSYFRVMMVGAFWLLLVCRSKAPYEAGGGQGIGGSATAPGGAVFVPSVADSDDEWAER